MRRAVLALTTCLALSGCFYSQRPLFDSNHAATPFPDGAQYDWRASGSSESEAIVYHLRQSAYQLSDVDGELSAQELMFFDVPETAEQDFIAQLRLDPSQAGRFYLFFWRTETGFRILASDSAFREANPGWSAFRAACGSRQLGGCKFATAEEVRAFYLRAVYPSFVAGDDTPADYTDQIQLTDATPGRPEPR